jgi:hypothetical protein
LTPREEPKSLLVRLAWFLALWAGGVGAVGLVALAVRKALA